MMMPLWIKEWHRFRNLSRVLRTQSRFKILFVSCFAIIMEAGLAMLFLESFQFLSSLGGIGLVVLNRLFALFFFGLGLMLAASSMASAYSTMYRSEDLDFLMVRPFPLESVTVFKFFESVGLSSWAYFFTVIPFAAAYAWHEQLSPLFAVWTLLFSIPYIIVCCAIGAILTMLILRLCPSSRRVRWIIITVLAVALIAGWKMAHGLYQPQAEAEVNLTRLLPGMNIAANPILPSWWMSDGILSLIRGDYFRGFMLLLVITANAAMAILILERLSLAIYYDTWQRIISGSGNANRAEVMLPWLEKSLLFLGRDIRAMVMKDIRTFFRDPIQWSQTVIFFGLLAMVFFNLRWFRYHQYPDVWRNTIAFLNVFSVAAVMSSLGSRFVYPQLSMEGHAFWILGLTPTTMRRILLTKFGLSLVCMTTVSVTLMILSAEMLNAALMTKVIAVSLAVALSFAISGLSTGLGAIFLDLRQTNPAAIVSGFGGTLNLVLSLSFLLGAILPYALAFHLLLTNKLAQIGFNSILVLASIWLIVLTALTTAIPLILADRSLRNRDFF
jgi:ABC-2 type transport system permease protein